MSGCQDFKHYDLNETRRPSGCKIKNHKIKQVKNWRAKAKYPKEEQIVVAMPRKYYSVRGQVTEYSGCISSEWPRPRYRKK